jgi:hypothetical protein
MCAFATVRLEHAHVFVAAAAALSLNPIVRRPGVADSAFLTEREPGGLRHSHPTATILRGFGVSEVRGARRGLVTPILAGSVPVPASRWFVEIRTASAPQRRAGVIVTREIPR